MTKIDPYLHAALLLKGADKEISEAHIAAVLKAAGVEADSAKAKVLAEALKGVNWPLRIPRKGVLSSVSSVDSSLLILATPKVEITFSVASLAAVAKEVPISFRSSVNVGTSVWSVSPVL